MALNIFGLFHIIIRKKEGERGKNRLKQYLNPNFWLPHVVLHHRHEGGEAGGGHENRQIYKIRQNCREIHEASKIREKRK